MSRLSTLHSPVFLLNSCLDLFSAPLLRGDPFSRSYGVSLPSSLTMNLSSALVYSTRPPVSVYGTGGRHLVLRGFSRELAYRRYHFTRRLRVLSRFGSARGFACAPQRLTRFNGLFRQPAGVSLLRHSVAVRGCDGMFTVSSIGVASRLRLRSRLTLIRLALIRKPWSYGGEVSRLPYRYLCLHLLFNALQHASGHTFSAHRMLPYQSCTSHDSTASVPGLCPIIIHARPLDQ